MNGAYDPRETTFERYNYWCGELEIEQKTLFDAEYEIERRDAVRPRQLSGLSHFGENFAGKRSLRDDFTDSFAARLSAERIQCADNITDEYPDPLPPENNLTARSPSPTTRNSAAPDASCTAD